MAIFATAFEKMIENEGGYILHTVEGDSGGMTYAGIARNYHPSWEGWKLIDNNNMSSDLISMVEKFYLVNFWDRIKCSEIDSQIVANSIFDFAVNAGTGIASKLAQIVVRSTPDGVIGPKTLEKINTIEESMFIPAFCIAKIARYANICNSNRSQSKFLLGWVNRALKGVM